MILWVQSVLCIRLLIRLVTLNRVKLSNCFNFWLCLSIGFTPIMRTVVLISQFCWAMIYPTKYLSYILASSVLDLCCDHRQSSCCWITSVFKPMHVNRTRSCACLYLFLQYFQQTSYKSRHLLKRDISGLRNILHWCQHCEADAELIFCIVELKRQNWQQTNNRLQLFSCFHMVTLVKVW